MDILRIKPIKSGERDFDFLVYYEGGTTERVIGKDACYDFIRDHSGLEAEASDAEISRKVSELVDAGIIEKQQKLMKKLLLLKLNLQLQKQQELQMMMKI